MGESDIIAGMVTKTEILNIAKQIKDHTLPTAIYLFGSYAYGNPHQDSDVDFMVVKSTLLNKRRELIDLKKSLHVDNVSVDVVLISADELQQRQQEGWTFYNEVLTKGILLSV